MNFLFIFRMITAMLVPVVLANFFYILDIKTKFGKLSVLKRQIIIGIVFGIFACLATQYGIQYDGYVMNVRTAIPLTAGLVFGGPTGIIAGVMGALYRWICIYWGMPSYTVVACSVATLLAGVIGTVCRVYMFSNKKTSWFYGMILGFATETFHMLLVFITHMDEIEKAYTIVSVTAIPMITANTCAVLFALLFVSLISKEKIRNTKYSKPITQTFSIYLLICVVISFLVTSVFTYFLQTNVTDAETTQVLTMSVEDVESDIMKATDQDLLDRTDSVRTALENNPEDYLTCDTDTSVSNLTSLLSIYSVSDINIIDANGIIISSTNPDFIGFNMATNGQAKDFLNLLNPENDTYVQAYGPLDYDQSISRKYAGASLSQGGFVQVGYDFDLFRGAVKHSIENVATHRHVGQSGYVLVASADDGALVSAPDGAIDSETIAAHYDSVIKLPDKQVITVKNVNDNGNTLIMKSEVEGFIVVACMPESEAHFARNISVYIGAFMQFVVFVTLFIVVFFLIKNVIVDNIHKINKSLARITGGDLSTKVNIYENEEFSLLSNDINATVARLKEFISDAEKRIDMELAFAKSIQHSVLPSVFPPYPNRDEFDIYASMDTAKEVGGDFYDFYLLGENKLAILIADVSGKGIPAAMFMMNAKGVIKSLCESGLAVNDVFTEANEKLCASNEAGMFVTAWMGIVDLETGVVKFANAGHNPPLVKHTDGTYEYLKSRPGLVLAGMEGMIYRENEFALAPGDEIYLYTDGVTEATNANTELFGEDRLQSILNAQKYESAEEICKSVKASLDDFVGEADQFDDITMLSLRYLPNKKRTQSMKAITVPASIDSIDRITEFVDAELEAADCSLKAQTQINIAIDEIFSNIAHYAYNDTEGEASVSIGVEDGLCTLIFIDQGRPFNPLEKEDPDVTQSADDREIGGLGIFMVKKTMDSVDYAYTDNRNILTITKHIN